ncbi:DNA polymerase IV [Paludibacterium sp. THUN1379]|uniref:DNA polymerase IV n=1 Tax=Paludibacterium sp. THUN1379 TaxID=3112107 RepID=UPI0030892526|nr:DNA polymerase IV [Paludibacterium sp. THUN1379]
MTRGIGGSVRPYLPPSVHVMTPGRKIIHIDCDCFYASIEMRDNPSWRGIPLAVGGRPDSRGVIATCNYEARRFGVHSAMSSRRALMLCPSLLIVPPDMARYKEASQRIMSIYRDYTTLIEPLSLDEAYLDVSGQPHCRGSATLMAEAIRQRIRDEIGITASAGIAPNKFLAKVASDWHKPDGQKVILPDEVDAFVAALPVSKVPGIGKVTAERMKRMGIETCADLRTRPRADLLLAFGRFGERLFQLARGEDEREVAVDRVRKSISVEETYATDLPDLDACLATLPVLLQKLQERIARAGNPSWRGISCKLKFTDFSQTTVEQADSRLDAAHFTQLLQMGYARGQQPVRLVGVGVRLDTGTSEPAARQLPLFD